VIQIDGSLGEGGGQVVRTAVSLAAITGLSVEVTRVRPRRDRPGLQPQHLAAVLAAGAICDATISGGRVGSDHFVFEPGRPPRAGEYIFDIRTAGAATLVLQTVLVPLLFGAGESSIEVIGGTHQPMAPSADYVEHVYVPALARLGAKVEVGYGPAGYYPRGGGRLKAKVDGGSLHAVDMTTRGERVSLDAFVVASRLPEHVSGRGIATVRGILPSAKIHVLEPHAFSPGAAVTLVGRHRTGLGGFSSIGRRGLPIENVAAEACELFAIWDRGDAACDEHLADQLVLPAALAKGTSRWTTPRVSEHLRTVLLVVDRFIPTRSRIEDGCITLVPPASATWRQIG
jgi:RNA 3'-terminal phosphate cyclase (ATP)